MRLLGRILARLLSSLFLAVVVFVVAPLVAVVTVLAALIFLPLPATIPAARTVQEVAPTVIYDADGDVIATLVAPVRNSPVPDSAIPDVLKEAVISDEDRDYYHEGGVDLRGVLRALVADLRDQSIVQGGSTITEQYVKLAYTDGNQTYLSKLREAILASQLSRQASKEDILDRYLNTVYLGDGNYGVGAAARNYFHVSVSGLDASQAATLAGLIPAPTDRAPREHLAAAESLRRLVLAKMLQQGYLTPTTYARALDRPLALAGVTHAKRGRVTLVWPQPQPPTSYPAFVSYVTAWLLQHFPASEVYGGGLRVQTTLEPAVQHDAQVAVDTTLAGTADPLEMGLASVEPQTGFIEALVAHRLGTAPQFVSDDFALGGCPAAPPKGDHDTVAPSCRTQPTIAGGGGGRQPGSSWKPFVLATAFDQHIPPTGVYEAPAVYQIPGCTVLAGQPATSCQIHNDEGESPGSETLSEATAQSTNTVYAQVAEQVGCANVARTARALGVTSAYYTPRVFPYCASYALGELGVSPLDMASAYGVFDDHGLRAPPTPILQIVGRNGRLLVDNIGTAPATHRVLAANVADNVTAALEGVITHGTGTRADLGRPAAGKTGTTSNTTDAWFVGYTPSLSTAVWMGDAGSEAVSIGAVKGFDQVYGGTLPAETWRAFMLAALAKVPATGFDQPAPIELPRPAITSGSTTPTTIGPGAADPVVSTPPGGPYEGEPPVPTPPSAVTTTTTTPATTTTTTGLSFPGG